MCVCVCVCMYIYHLFVYVCAEGGFRRKTTYLNSTCPHPITWITRAKCLCLALFMHYVSCEHESW